LDDPYYARFDLALLGDQQFLNIFALGPVLYYVCLLLLCVFSASFRALFFPPIFEGSAAKAWNDFRASRDARWGPKLLFPSPRTHGLISGLRRVAADSSSEGLYAPSELLQALRSWRGGLVRLATLRAPAVHLSLQAL